MAKSRKRVTGKWFKLGDRPSGMFLATLGCEVAAGDYSTRLRLNRGTLTIVLTERRSKPAVRRKKAGHSLRGRK